MSSTSTQATTQPRNTTSRLFSSRSKKPTGRVLDSATIASDIAAFKKSGGRIEILGNTPYRAYQPTAFRSASSQRKANAATPTKTAARKSAKKRS